MRNGYFEFNFMILLRLVRRGVWPTENPWDPVSAIAREWRVVLERRGSTSYAYVGLKKTFPSIILFFLIKRAG